MLKKLILKAIPEEMRKELIQDEEGGVIVEYGLLVGLLVLTIAGAMTLFGGSISTWLVSVAGAVSSWGPLSS